MAVRVELKEERKIFRKFYGFEITGWLIINNECVSLMVNMWKVKILALILEYVRAIQRERRQNF